MSRSMIARRFRVNSTDGRGDQVMPWASPMLVTLDIGRHTNVIYCSSNGKPCKSNPPASSTAGRSSEARREGGIAGCTLLHTCIKFYPMNTLLFLANSEGSSSDSIFSCISNNALVDCTNWLFFESDDFLRCMLKCVSSRVPSLLRI